MDFEAFFAGIDGWDVALAVLTLIATWVAFALVKKGAAAAVERIGGLSPNARLIVVRMAKYLVLLLGVAVALTFLGAQLQPLLTVTIIVVAVLALAMRGVADNFGSGVIIQTRKTVSVGDEITSQGQTGVVTELNGRSVLIKRGDGTLVHIPNSDLLQELLINNTETGCRRSQVQVRVRAPGELDVEEELLGLVRAVDGVLPEPAPDALFVAVEPERITLTLRFWHQPMDYVDVPSRVVRALGAHLRSTARTGTVTSAAPDEPLVPAPPV